MSMLVRTTYSACGKDARQNFSGDDQLMRFNGLVREAAFKRTVIKLHDVTIMVSTGLFRNPVVLSVRGSGYETRLASDGELNASEAEAALQKFCRINLSSEARRSLSNALLFNEGTGSISSSQGRLEPVPTRAEVRVTRRESADGAAFLGALVGAAIGNALSRK